MTEQWQELKETIMALSTSEGTATQQEVCTFLINLMDLLEKQMQEPKTGHWISVSERLPEKDGFYLATLDGEICGEDKPFCGLAEFEKGKWIDDEEDYQCVIAWMPLPEPYKAETEEK